MSKTFNKFISVSLQYYAGFSIIIYFCVVAKVTLSRGVSKHAIYTSAELSSVRAPKIPLEIAGGVTNSIRRY